MSRVEKPNLKRKPFAEHLAIVIEASFKEKELDFEEFSKRKNEINLGGKKL